VVVVLEHTFNLSQVEVTREYSPELPLFRGDEEKLKQVFINLFNNAFDAVGQDGVVEIKTGLNAEDLEISISDTGRGIAPENIEKIFDPFFTTKGPHKGTGLGLSVAFGIIKEHGGRVKVYSPDLADEERQANRRSGTKFVVYLPIACVHP